MKIKWQKLICKICFWLLAEAVFNLIGIDDLVDYSEFLSMPKATLKAEYYSAGYSLT
ncbi:MAG: hypothetical protein AAGE84_00050 [Cyanobacteria bacterium P01_G01_bin.39]